MPQLIASIEGVTFKNVTLTKAKTTLGRRPYNDIVFENLVCSGEHCVFYLDRGEVDIADLGSTNGTSINGEKIEAKRRLKDKDVIGIGRYRIQYLASTPEPQVYQRTQDMDVGGHSTAPAPLEPVAPQASFLILSGSSAGLEMPVVKAVTTFGKRGVCVASVAHRQDGYFVAHLEGEERPTLNGIAVGAPLAMADGDVLELAGTRMQFSRRG